jgi:hypothetical protein
MKSSLRMTAFSSASDQISRASCSEPLDSLSGPVLQAPTADGSDSFSLNIMKDVNGRMKLALNNQGWSFYSQTWAFI